MQQLFLPRPIPAELKRNPQAADAADSSPYSRPSGLSVSGFPEPAEEREAEIPEDAPPSPAQVVSMINALARMRAIGIMDNAEYRDKYDKLMKLM